MSTYEIAPTTSNTLLSYAVTTLPDPLQQSPEQGNTVYGALTFVVSNTGTEAVSLAQVQFDLPIGILAQDITSDPDAILYGSSPIGQWNISQTSSGVFTAIPASGQPVTVTTSGIVFQLFNIPINQQPGPFQLPVKETASSASQPLQIRTATFDLAKFPYGFYFSNFTSHVPLVQDGNPVTLSWDGSDQATYMMYWGAQQPQDVTQVRTWTSPNLTTDTTFLLRAQVVSQGETVTRDLSVTVIVANPELQATTLQVSSTTGLQGNTTIGSGGNSQLTINAALTSNGSVLLNNGLTAGSTSTMTNLTVNQQFTASSSAQLGATTTQNLTVNGTLTAPGTVGLMQAVVVLGQNATYTAHTDGLIIGAVSSPSDPYNTYGSVQASYQMGGQTVTASATGSYYSPAGFNSFYNQSFVLPVPAGTNFSTSVPQPLSTPPPIITFFFIALGKANGNPVSAVGSPESQYETTPEPTPAPEHPTFELLRHMADLLIEGDSEEKKKRLKKIAEKFFGK
jgi:hypothetical protein